MAAAAPAYALDDAALLAQCAVEAFRSGGPGGQHANRTASAVRLTHRATGATAQCQDHRERGRNPRDALRRLRVRLAGAVRGAADPAWLDPYRRGRQLALGAAASDYHLAVAVALDALEAASGAVAEAADALGVSTTQLAKLLVADRDARAAADALRARHGLAPLKP